MTKSTCGEGPVSANEEQITNGEKKYPEPKKILKNKPSKPKENDCAEGLIFFYHSH